MHDKKLPTRVLLGSIKSQKEDWSTVYTSIIEVNVLEYSPSFKYLKGASPKDPTYNRWYDLENEYKVLEILE